MPSREQILELNSEQVDLQRTGVSNASAAVTITVAGDSLSPAAPSSVSANAVPKGILVEWTNPTLNEDSTTCYDQRWAKLYYKSTTGVTKSVYDGTYVVGAKQGTNSSFTDPNVGTGTDRYYVVTAMDANGNESTASSEVNSTGGGAGETTSIPDDSTGLVFDDTVGTEGIVVGDGILGIAFKQPASTWSNFDHYRLWYGVDSNGGFGAWTEITPTNRIGYLHKGLTKTSSYRYKGTIVAEDGTESSTPDKAKADDSGYTPNGSANNLLIAELIFAENLICVNEVRGEHFFAQSYLAINDDTFGNDGIQLEYNSGNPRAYIGDGSDAFLNFDGTKLTWKAANTELDASGNLVATSVDLTGAITASSGTIGSFTIGTYLYTGSKTAYDDANAGVHLGSDGLGIGNNVFTVSSAGALVATSATITGTITSSAITITGGTFNINSGVFSVSAAGALVASSATITGTITSSAVTITGGTLNINSGVFSVSAAGALVASSATITGAVTISSGSGIANLSDAGGLATEDTVGAGDCDATIISGGKIITGLLTASNITTGTLDASVVSIVNLTVTGVITCQAGSSYAGNSISTTYTTAKCTDAAADQTSAHTSADTSAVNSLASTTLISGGKIGTNLVEAAAINVTNLAAINADLGSITAGSININSGVFTVSAAGALVASSATITGAITSSSVTITGGTLNIGSGAFTVNAAGAVACSALTVTGTSTWDGVDIGYGHIAANAVRTAELYIDGDVNFKPDAVYHKIIALNRIEYAANYFLSISEGIFAGGTNNVLSLDDGEGIAFRCSLWPGDLKIADFETTSEAAGNAEGTITVLVSGLTRTIRLYEV